MDMADSDLVLLARSCLYRIRYNHPCWASRNFLSILFQPLDADTSDLLTVAQVPANPETQDTTSDPPLEPFTCPWAQDGLRRALEGLTAASSGVEGYGVGSRHLRYKTVAEQAVAIDTWQRLVDLYCGTDTEPLVGRDTAFRVIPRDV